MIKGESYKLTKKFKIQNLNKSQLDILAGTFWGIKYQETTEQQKKVLETFNFRDFLFGHQKGRLFDVYDMKNYKKSL